jgi:hypothetical protein
MGVVCALECVACGNGLVLQVTKPVKGMRAAQQCCGGGSSCQLYQTANAFGNFVLSEFDDLGRCMLEIKPWTTWTLRRPRFPGAIHAPAHSAPQLGH